MKCSVCMPFTLSYISPVKTLALPCVDLCRRFELSHAIELPCMVAQLVARTQISHPRHQFFLKGCCIGLYVFALLPFTSVLHVYELAIYTCTVGVTTFHYISIFHFVQYLCVSS